MKSILKLLIVIIVFSACKSDDLDNFDNTIDITNKGYLKSIYKNGYLIFEYKYNNNGTLKSKLRYGQLVEYSYLVDTIFENSNSELVKYYKKNGNTVVKNMIYNDNTSQYEDYIFTDECSYTTVNHFDSLNNNVRRIEYEYTENCGYSSFEFNVNNVLTATFVVVKDNKKAFNQKIKIPLLQIENDHNIIKKEVYNSPGSLSEFQSYNNIITYNSEGYPINKRREYYDGDVDEYVYEYY